MSKPKQKRMTAVAWREIRGRWMSFALALLAVTAGTAAVVASLASLAAYDRRTEAVLTEHARETEAGLRQYNDILRKAMRKLGFNVTILPKEQQLADFYADDYAVQTMPEADAERLAEAGVMSIGHWVPVLRQKFLWPEQNWTLLLLAFGQTHSGPGATDQSPDVPAVPRGSADLGWELHRGLELQPGDRIRLGGEAFTVRRCLPESGSTQDVSLRMNLKDAQRLLGMEGRINEIRALQCRTAWNRLDQVKADIQAVLPAVQVIEKGTQTVAVAAAREAFETGRQQLLAELKTSRASQRLSRVRLSLSVCALALMLALITAGTLAWINAAERRVEIAVWNALGIDLRHIQGLFARRALLAGLAGGLLGWLAGAGWWGWPGMRPAVTWAALAIAVGLLAVFPAGVAVIVVTSRIHPADMLRNEI